MLTNLEALKLLLAEALRAPDPLVGRDVAALALASVVASTDAARDAGITLARRRLAEARPLDDHAS
jgi:hypothetical protein